MLQVDFYILADNSQKNIEQLCCQLCEKALLNNMTVLIYTQSDEQAEKLDNLLWSFKPVSFIVHKNLLGQLNKEDTSSDTLTIDNIIYPVLITNKINPEQSQNDLLINLNTSPPPGHLQFKRIAELVDKNPQAKENARNSYRFYQQQDYQLKKYNL